MSGFRDIKRAYDAYAASGSWADINTGLIYTCNAGWLDLGHLNPYSDRRLIGAGNLWQHVRNEGTAVLRSACSLSNADLNIGYTALMHWMSNCNDDPYMRFPDNRTGYAVAYRQDHGGLHGNPGREGRYLVKHGLTPDQKQSVALSIFIDVSHDFESFQDSWYGRRVTDSGYSQEDLVSNLVGFYVAIGAISKTDAIAACHPVSRQTAESIWNVNGAVGDNKNRTFVPQLQPTGYDDPVAMMCRDECALQPRSLPAVFRIIQPARLGTDYIRLGSGPTLIPD